MIRKTSFQATVFVINRNDFTRMNRIILLNFFFFFFAQSIVDAQDIQEKKFSTLLEIGALGGTEISRSPGDFKLAYTFKVSGFRQINSTLSLGGGIGIENYERELLLPIFLDLRSLIHKKDNSPYLNLQIGYALAWHEDYTRLVNYEYEGGAFMSFFYGRQVPISSKVKFNMAIGLRFQSLGLEINDTFVEKYEENINFVLLELKSGIQF